MAKLRVEPCLDNSKEESEELEAPIHLEKARLALAFRSPGGGS